MAKTYIAKKIIREIHQGFERILYYAGQTLPRDEAMKHADAVKLVETKYPMDANSFECTPEDFVEKERVVEENTNPKAAKAKITKK